MTYSNTAGTNIHLTHSDTDDATSLRGRLGYAFDNFLIYGTAGWEWTSGTNTRPQLIGTTGLATRGTVEQINVDRSGATYGAGLEYAFARNWSIFGEYRHSSYDRVGLLFPISQRFTRARSSKRAL
jgi:high affinity Mn2+ porin